jgi:hypothetical protein
VTGETVVGGAYVRIGPLLDTFRAELIAKLKAATAGVKVKIPVEVDSKAIDVLVAKLAGLDRKETKPKVKVQGTDQAITDLEEVAAAAEAIPENVTIEVDVSGYEVAAAQLSRLAFLRALASGEVGPYRQGASGPNWRPFTGTAWQFYETRALGAGPQPAGQIGPLGSTSGQPNWRRLSASESYFPWAKAAYFPGGANPQLGPSGSTAWGRTTYGQMTGEEFNPWARWENNPSNPVAAQIAFFRNLNEDLRETTSSLEDQAAAAVLDADGLARARSEMAAAGIAGAYLRTMVGGQEVSAWVSALGAGAAGGAAGGKGGGGGWLGPLLMGAAFGRGGRFLGGLGGGFLGLAGLGAGAGSLASFGGLGPEHLAMTALGLGGSMVGGLMGGGLLAAGALSTMAVGAGTNLAGIGQAAGDIRTVTTDINNLHRAIALYGAGSREAATAQRQLNYDLAGFSPVARQAVVNSAHIALAFKTMFDKATGPAERLGAIIIGQAMKVGEKFIPTIGQFAKKNMGILEKDIQPLFKFLTSPAPGHGLGTFIELENIFSKRFPTAIHAGTMMLELFVKTIAHVAPMTGRLLDAIDRFFTKYNSGTGLKTWMKDVDKLIADFRMWDAFVKILVRDIFALFKNDAGTARSIVTYLTDMLTKLHAWETSAAGAARIHSIFVVHRGEIMALLPILVHLITAFGQLYTILAVPATKAVTYLIGLFGHFVNMVSHDPFAAWVGGIGLLMAKLGVLKPAMAGLGMLDPSLRTLPGIGKLFGSTGPQAANTAALEANTLAVDANTVARGGDVPGAVPSSLPGGLRSVGGGIGGTLATIGFAALAGDLLGHLIFPMPKTVNTLAGVPSWAWNYSAKLGGQNYTNVSNLPPGILGAMGRAGWTQSTPALDQAFLAQLNTSTRASALAAQGQRLASQGVKGAGDILKIAAEATQQAAVGNLAAANKAITAAENLIAAAGLLARAAGGLNGAASQASTNLAMLGQAYLRTGSGGAPRKHLARGGPIRPGEMAVVGEVGPELLTMGPGGGYVTPNSALRFLASGTTSAPAGSSAFFNFEQLASNQLYNLQSISQSGLSPLQQLQQQLTQVHQQALEKLIAQLKATHQLQLISLANQLIAAQKQANAALNQQIWLTWQQGTDQLIADMAQAAASLIADGSQMSSDVTTALATLVGDSSAIAQAKAQTSAQAIADQSKLWVDQYGEKFQFGISLQAARAQVALDKLNARYDAEIGASRVRAAQSQQAQDVLTANAQRNLDHVTKWNDIMVRNAQKKYDEALRTGNQIAIENAHHSLVQAQAIQQQEVAKAQAALQQQQARAQRIQQQEAALIGNLQNAQGVAAAKIQAEIDKLQAEVPGAQGLAITNIITSHAEPSAIAQEMAYELRRGGVL